MQLPTGGAQAIAPASENNTAISRTPGRDPRRPRLRWLLAAIVVVVAAGLGVYLRHQRALVAQKTLAARTGFRTFTVAPATVVRSLRLSGVTAAESYVSLLTPHLRGSRGGGGSGGSSLTTVQMPTAVQSNSGTSSSSSSPAVPGSSSGGNSAGIGVSSGFSTKNAFQASTSRNISRSSTSSAAAAQSADSSSSDASGLGSTAGSLLRIGGAGGGSNWNLTLQDAVKPGSVVKKGEVVAEFDRQYMLLRLDDYRAAVLQDQNSLKSLQAQLEVTAKAHEQTIRSAKADVDKARLDMKTIPVRSAIDAEKFRLALEEAEARYRQVLSEVKYVKASQLAQIRDREIGLQQTTIEYNRAAANAEKMIVKAPIGGLAVMRSLFRGGEMAQIQVGDQLWPGMMFMQIVDNRSMVLNATVNQVDIERIRLGQKANVGFDAYPDLHLPAHIVAIGAMTNSGGMRQNFVKNVPVRLELDRIDSRVIPDLTVSIDIQLETVNAQAAVPLEAVFRQSAGGAPFVYVRDGSAWRRREVRPGVSSNITTAIETGLVRGEVVALERPAGEPGVIQDPAPGKHGKE
ncbi:MAG: HlyD family efflux transporter periplasmic adaptor subunit [Bryobacterales bacterium]|nr:HlyD family efflux transporter periplasmic adaptor subunit [Bryobacterales bacterium]